MNDDAADLFRSDQRYKLNLYTQVCTGHEHSSEISDTFFALINNYVFVIIKITCFLWFPILCFASNCIKNLRHRSGILY